jgi:hypothetical protein
MLVDVSVDEFGCLLFAGITLRVKLRAKIWWPDAEFFILNVKTDKYP